MEQNQNGREEIAQIIEEHIDFMTRRYRETGSVFKSIVTKIGFFPYMECFGKVLMDKDWDRLNNLIYQENCFRSLCSLMCGDTRYWAFLDMLDALAVGNMKTLELLIVKQGVYSRALSQRLDFSCIQTCHQYADRTLAQGQQRFGLCRSEGKKICVWKKTAMGTGGSSLFACSVR